MQPNVDPVELAAQAGEAFIKVLSVDLPPTNDDIEDLLLRDPRHKAGRTVSQRIQRSHSTATSPLLPRIIADSLERLSLQRYDAPLTLQTLNLM